ncbi:hypothetical protein [uncultured Thiodictyon sp.]|uniref:hypothetical protein n=1 Tax=uncultured Thiodictyon sp. TaxID=1846217 RepID=UPI0025E2EA8F|nr:hypothetical protein [uncultured Thiodictyon sp.]
MAAPYLNDWSPDAKGAANAALRAAVDAETDPSYISIHSSSDTLLAEIPLARPIGSVDSGTGIWSLSPDGREEEAPANGTAAYATIRDGAGMGHHSLPCEAGSSPVAGKCVLNTLAIAAGKPVELVSWTVG